MWELGFLLPIPMTDSRESNRQPDGCLEDSGGRKKQTRQSDGTATATNLFDDLTRIANIGR